MSDNIMISGDLAARLRAAAQRAHLEVEEYLAQQLEDQEDDKEMTMPSTNPNQALIEAIQRANIIVDDPTVSARSREIIEEEMEKHLIRRLEDDKPNE
jgi:hypothetical protein